MPFRLSVTSLNVLIAILSIAATAAVTLGISLYFSIDSAHQMALGSVRVMAEKARDQMMTFAFEPVSAALSIQYSAQFGDARNSYSLPSETFDGTDSWIYYWERLQGQYMRQVDFRYQYATIAWEDGFYVGCKLIADDTSIFQCRSFSRESSTATVSQLVERNFSKKTGALLGQSQAVATYDPRQREWYKSTQQVYGASNWSEVYLSAVPTLPIVDLNSAFFNSSGHFQGINGFAFELGQLDTVLKSISPFMDSSSTFLLDNNRRILASSMNLQTYKKLPVERSYVLTAEEVKRGCIISDMNTAASPSVICQHDIESFGFGPLSTLKSKHPNLIVPPTTEERKRVTSADEAKSKTFIDRYTLDGVDYYVAIVDISTTSTSNMRWQLLSFLPVSIVTESISKGRDVAIGVAVGLAVAISFAAGLLVKVMLSPLSLIAERMETAAYLRVRGGGVKGDYHTSSCDSKDEEYSDEEERDNPDMLRERAQAAEDALIKSRKVSYLSDVAAIQNAYWDMADELWALKGYIPEHVTKGVIAKIAAKRAEMQGEGANAHTAKGGGNSSSDGGGAGARSNALHASQESGGSRKGTPYDDPHKPQDEFGAEDEDAFVNQNRTLPDVEASTGQQGGISEADVLRISQMPASAVVSEHFKGGEGMTKFQGGEGMLTSLPFFSPVSSPLGNELREANAGGSKSSNGLVEMKQIQNAPLREISITKDAANALKNRGGGAAAATEKADSNSKSDTAKPEDPGSMSAVVQGNLRSSARGGEDVLRLLGGSHRSAISRTEGGGTAAMMATMGSMENVSVVANRLAGLAKVEDDVPIFFGDNVLVDRDITIVHINIVNFHKYCRVTHGKDLKQEHAAFVNLVYNVARKCGGVLDTFSGDKFFVSFNAASKCIDHPIAAVCFAHEVSSIVAKDAIWGTHRRRIEQQCRMDNQPIPPDSKAFPPHVYKSAPFGITCGVATGRAFVGPLGSDRILRHSVLSNAMTEAVALERLCLKYPACRVLIAGDLITMIDQYFSYQLLDAAVLPGTQGKRRRLASVKGPLKRPGASSLRGGCRSLANKARSANIYSEMNDCFLAFLEGRIENCKQSLQLVDQKIETESIRLQLVSDSSGVALTQNEADAVRFDLNGEAPITEEECADMVIMSQFIWSLLQSNPPIDGRVYRSPLGEAYQPVQHALYLVPPRPIAPREDTTTASSSSEIKSAEKQQQ